MKKTLFMITVVVALCSDAQSQNKFGTLLRRSYASIDEKSTQIILVTFTDKGIASYAPSELLSQKAIRRRLKARPSHAVTDEADFPLEQSYVRSVQRHVVALRHQLKWFNAVSALATKSQIGELQNLPFVKEIDLVGRWKSGKAGEITGVGQSVRGKSRVAGVTSLDYGGSYAQLQQIQVPAVHHLGIYGQGVLICMFDEGVHNPADPVFDSLNVVSTYDFVDHKVSVVPRDPAAGGHGEATLSIIGGYAPGSLIGPAFRAGFLLARTENDSSETPIEEDNWAKGIEWADSIGVDVTSTSLVYLSFDAPYQSMTWHDMDGVTALITRAGDRADSLGIVVVNAAGNAGRDSTHNTLWAPADGINIITVGAVDTVGTVMGFSSNGPTVDGRIKPDVMAMGMGGTSFACPLAAGVAALILCANPDLTPAQVRDAMRNTASDASSPDNFHGWGVLNALSAVNYFGITNHLSGTAFDDRNGNGKRDVDEAFLTGMNIKLHGQKSDSLLSDVHGNFLFDSLSLGQYTVTIDPINASILRPVSQSYQLTVDSSHRIYGNLDFGLFRPAVVRGGLFIDLNNNGSYDAGDATPANWPVILSGSALMTVYTDSSGLYSFPPLGPGTYLVRDSLPPHWQEIAPGHGISFSIASTSGLDTTLPSFGNQFVLANPVVVVDGWNLLSLPYRTSQHAKDSVYPTSVSKAFTFKDGYQTADTITPGVGYWLKFSGSATLPVSGMPLPSDTIFVTGGWNLIGSVSFPVAVGSIGSIPPGLSLSGFFYYTAGGTYAVADTIQPGRGYWVKTDQPGTLILSSSASQSGNNRIRILPSSEMPPPPPVDGKNELSPKGIPSVYLLEQNFPNPFNPSTKLTFGLPEPGYVRLELYNTLGQSIGVIVSGPEEAGYHSVVWNATVGSGVYFCRLTAVSLHDPGKSFTQVRKMLLIR